MDLLRRAELVAVPLPVLCELVWVLKRVYGFAAADCVAAIEALLAALLKKLAVADGKFSC